MNNLGGFKEIELVFVDELTVCVPVSGKMYICKKTINRRLLPLTKRGATLTATAQTTDAGSLYEQNAVIPLPRKMNKDLKGDLASIDRRPCILIATTNNNEVNVYGSKEFPLLGNLINNPGTLPSDLANLQLSLTTKITHQELPLLE